MELTIRIARDLGSREGTERDVGGDNLPVVTAGFIDEHGDAVRFLAVSTTGAPDGMRCTARFAHELGQCCELRGVAKKGAVLNGDSVQQIVKRGGLVVEHVDVRGHGNSGEVRAFFEQSLEPSTACGLGLESGSRAKELRRVIERIHCVLGVVASTGRTVLLRAIAPALFRRCAGAAAVRPNSRDTALSSPTSSKEALLMYASAPASRPRG